MTSPLPLSLSSSVSRLNSSKNIRPSVSSASAAVGKGRRGLKKGDTTANVAHKSPMDVLRQSLPKEIDPYDLDGLDQRERVDVGRPKVCSDVVHMVIRFSPDYLFLIEDIELSRDNPDYHTRRTFTAWSIRRCKVRLSSRKFFQKGGYILCIILI